MRLSGTRRYRTPGAVLLIDLDEFKPINDRHGHAAGDAALCEVARVLANHTRESDLAVRLGGDEFAVLLDQATSDGADRCANKLLDLLHAIVLPFAPAGLRASIGIAGFPGCGETPDAVLAAADRALYRAKREGRDRVCADGTESTVEPVNSAHH